MVGALAVVTLFVTMFVRAYHTRRIEARQAALRTDERFRDIPSSMNQYRDLLIAYNKEISAFPKEQRAKNKLLVMLKDAQDRKKVLVARTDLPAEEKEKQLVILEREIAGIMIDMNATESSAMRMETAKKNKAIACQKIRENVPKLGELKLQKYWVGELERLCGASSEQAE